MWTFQLNHCDYRQHCMQHNTPVFKLLRGQFWGFSPRRGDTLHRWGWRVWGTPENFNQFRAVASLLHRRCSTEVNRTLHDVWLSPALVRIHCRCSLISFPEIQLISSFLRSIQLWSLTGVTVVVFECHPVWLHWWIWSEEASNKSWW